MAIELDVKPKDKLLFPSTVLLIISIVIFSVFLASYIFFEVRNRFMDGEMKDIEKKLVLTPDEVNLEAKIVDYQDKINSFGTYFTSRRQINNLFAVLEKNSHPNVAVTKISWDINSPMITIDAIADNLESFSQQAMIWKNIPSLNSIKLSALEKGKEETGFEFTVQLTFDNGAFE